LLLPLQQLLPFLHIFQLLQQLTRLRSNRGSTHVCGTRIF
jgi:hypothetical protein